MSQMIRYGKELIRISPKDPKKIEYSNNDGYSWYSRGTCVSGGKFLDLTDNGKEILATMEKGVFYSNTAGRNWYRRGS